MAANDMDREQILAHARAEMGLQGADNVLHIRCPSCPFVAVSHAQFSVHALGHLQDHRPTRRRRTCQEASTLPPPVHKHLLQARGLGKLSVRLGAVQDRL